MTLKPITEARLLALAARRGQTPEALLDAVIERESHEIDLHEINPSASISKETLTAGYADPTLVLFAQWAEEDKTGDPEELARRQQEGDELLENLRKYPVSFRRVDVSGPGWD